jgi:ribosomal protein S12 methylthiotransferase accessory factor
MPPAPHLPGKDARLDQTITRCRHLLFAMGLETEDVSWRHPAPHCWSVHLRCTTAPRLYSNGKGVTRRAALASALGEFFERLATNFFFTDAFLDEDHGQPFLFYPEERWFASKNGKVIKKAKDGSTLLTPSLWRLYDPEKKLGVDLLRDHNTDMDRPGIAALPFHDMTHGAQVYFPVSLLNNLYVSNGMAAGNSSAEATAQALAEIFERYVKNLIIAGGISLPDIPRTHLGRYPGILATLDRLADAGYAVRLKDGSLGGRFPVVCALLTDRKSGGVYAAFGASLRFTVAIERTLSELLQGRHLSSLRNFREPEHDLAMAADPCNLESHFIDSDGLLAWSMFRDRPDYPFSPWDFKGTTEEEVARLLTIFASLEASAYRAEYRHCGMYACRIIVPGISEIYPLDDMFYNNRIKGAILRSRLLRLGDYKRSRIVAVFEELEEMGLSDHQLLGEAIGVYFDADTAWATLRLGELKALLYLAVGEKEEALQWCRWVIDHATLPADRHRHYQLLHALLGFHLANWSSKDYMAALALRHSHQEITEAEALITGEASFSGLQFARSWSEISKEHRAFLALYRRLNQFKSNGIAGS